MTSRLAVRLAGLALAIGLVWYLTSQNAEIARLRAGAPSVPGERGAAAPAPPPANPPVPAAPRTLSPEQRQAMIEKLGVTPGSPVWFATIPNNPEAAAFQKALQGVFEEAGWQVRGNAAVQFPMKPGIFVFAADEEPPDYLSSVNEALEAAGLTVTSGRGYREFVRQKKEEKPDWVGLELGPEDTYVIAVGRAG
jgi:membrane-associated protease RseP (regulator of RpoE activity)